jgi:hypothetical protein
MSRRGNASSSSSSSSSSSGDAKSGGDAKEAAETTRKMDKLYEYDEAYAQAQDDKHPWTKDINHFKSCKVSALASMKMLKHALIGASLSLYVCVCVCSRHQLVKLRPLFYMFMRLYIYFPPLYAS